MQFESGCLYHIYNQGNNRQKIFFERENYLYFLRKVRVYLLPFCDILAYCLMPNHFHFMVRVNKIEATIHPVTPSHRVNEKPQTLNNSIAILLRSYTRAINKQNGTTGSLFRQKTKSECVNPTNGVTPLFFNTNSGTIININNPEKQYQQVCFNYVHDNPLKAGLVKKNIDWEFSSASDYAGIRDGTLVNRDVAKEYVELRGGYQLGREEV